MQSIAILGRQPALGLAELESLYGAAAITPVAEHVAGVALPTDQIDFTRLGGSTRLATVAATIPTNLWKDVEKQLAKSIVEIARELPEGKLQLGLSTFGIPITPAKLNATGLTLKKIVRGRTDRSVRLTPNPQLELNTAQVLHNHLTGQTGIEMLIIATPGAPSANGSSGNSSGQTIIARTVAVQDIDSYTVRDRMRPKRDARVGMLPPKLAQIITNLAVGPGAPGATILDPFCGTGVLLQEALLMGYNVCGTDLEPRMIAYSKENLEWFTEKFNAAHNFHLEPGDATSHTWQTPIDAVGAETYLGRPFTERPAPAVLAQTSTEVNLIIKKFLKNIHPQLAPGTRLCLAVPAWATAAAHGDAPQASTFKHLPLIDQLSELGYNRTRFEHVRDEQLLYYREDQIVARELLVLTRK
jgi:SAM-dependent methyltransferase